MVAVSGIAGWICGFDAGMTGVRLGAGFALQQAIWQWAWQQERTAGFAQGAADADRNEVPINIRLDRMAHAIFINLS